jgi:hypothetical protein
MSSSVESRSFVDRYWQVFVILYGIAFVTLLMSFSPAL